MTVTLLVLAAIAAANPFRAAAASRSDASLTTAGTAATASLGLVAVAAAASGPLLEAIDVTGPSARIAAGIALLVVCLRDVFLPPSAPEPGLPGWKAGLIPLSIPVIFSPALALVAIAGASGRGIVVAVLGSLPALALAAVAIVRAPFAHTRPLLVAVGGLGVAIAAFVVLDGVYAI